MIVFHFIIATLSCSVLTTAFPLTRATTLTAARLVQVAPSTASCDGAAYTSECRTADTAAPAIAVSFTNFNIDSFGAQAALVALMLYESGNFQYSQNHFPAPGAPGKGTRNMQSPTYNLKYAEWLSIHCPACGISESDISSAQASGPAAVLNLVNTDEWSFGSAAWFLATQCDGSVLQGLAQGSVEGWSTYLTQCVGTSATEDRTLVWQQVMALDGW